MADYLADEDCTEMMLLPAVRWLLERSGSMRFKVLIVVGVSVCMVALSGCGSSQAAKYDKAVKAFVMSGVQKELASKGIVIPGDELGDLYDRITTSKEIQAIAADVLKYEDVKALAVGLIKNAVSNSPVGLVDDAVMNIMDDVEFTLGDDAPPTYVD